MVSIPRARLLYTQAHTCIHRHTGTDGAIVKPRASCRHPSSESTTIYQQKYKYTTIQDTHTDQTSQPSPALQATTSHRRYPKRGCKRGVLHFAVYVYVWDCGISSSLTSSLIDVVLARIAPEAAAVAMLYIVQTNQDVRTFVSASSSASLCLHKYKGPDSAIRRVLRLM